MFQQCLLNVGVIILVYLGIYQRKLQKMISEQLRLKKNCPFMAFVVLFLHNLFLFSCAGCCFFYTRFFFVFTKVFFFFFCKTFKNVCNWRSFCTKNNASNNILLDFNAVNMFSRYLWHVHNVESLLKVFFGFLRPSVTDAFEIFAQELFLLSIEIVAFFCQSCLLFMFGFSGRVLVSLRSLEWQLSDTGLVQNLIKSFHSTQDSRINWH